MMDRRTMLKGGLAVAATAHTAALAPALSDPIVEALRRYRAGLLEFNKLAHDDDDDARWDEYGKATYVPWQNMLDEWERPAQTKEGAIEALRAALDDDFGVRGSPAADSMIKAAIGFLESSSA